MKKALVVFLVLVAFASAVTFAARRLPVHYAVRSRPIRLARLSRGEEAFIFIEEQRWGRASSVATDEVSKLLPRMLRQLAAAPDLLSSHAIAFHLTEGKLEQFELPNMGAYAHFVISERALCVVSSEYANVAASGFRWTGSEFVAVSPNEAAELLSLVSGSAITPSDEDNSSEMVSPFQREKEILAGQGWDYKHFPTYGYKDKTIQFKLQDAEFTLAFHAPPKPAPGSQDFYSALMPAGSIALSGPGSDRPERVIYRAPEWEAVSQAQYLALESPSNREGRVLARHSSPLVLASLLIYLLPAFPFLRWLLMVLTLKRKILKNLPNTYGFPPARVEQFPKLDQAGLQKITQDFEALGFTKLMDFSMVPDSGQYIPAFSRLMAHPRHHCFVEIFQIFPAKKGPMPLTYNISSNLHHGWSFSSGVRKTMALSYMMRLPKCLWVYMPGVGRSQLLAGHLARRNQITNDLGISASTDMSIEAYQACVLQRHAERRAAIQKKNIFFGLGEALAFKLRPKHEWLGDYPKQAAQKREPWKYPARA